MDIDKAKSLQDILDELAQQIPKKNRAGVAIGPKSVLELEDHVDLDDVELSIWNRFLTYFTQDELYVFLSMWYNDENIHNFFILANDIRDRKSLSPLSFEQFDRAWQFLTILHGDINTALDHFRMAIEQLY